MNKLHFFIKDNGNLFVFKGDLPEIPKRPIGCFDYVDIDRKNYQEALQRAKKDAVLVDNQDEVLKALLFDPIEGIMTVALKNHIYSLEGCEMTLKNYCTNKHTISGCTNETCWDLEECQAKVSLALITFSEKKEDKPTPEKKEEESQEQIWEDVWDRVSDNFLKSHIPELMRYYTITRKQSL